MRTDPAKAHATQKEGKKDEAADLDARRQPVSAANRDRAKGAPGDSAEDRVRSQAPGFGHGQR